MAICLVPAWRNARPGVLSLPEQACYLGTVDRGTEAVLHRSLADILSFDINETALEQLSWRDFGNGLRMARLARTGSRELVLYQISATAPADAFLKHEHLGGEIYLVLQGRIVDETGDYEKGEIVYLDPNSVHAPRAVGETLVLVLWPGGVRLVD